MQVEFLTYKSLVKQLSIGKQLPDAVYLHVSAVPAEFQTLLADTIQSLQLQQFNYQAVKFFKRDFKLSLLRYPGFFEEAFPVLHGSCTIDLSKGAYRQVSYLNSENPPILHRKETMLLPEHPDIPGFRALTQEYEQAGLFENTRIIGFKRNWERLIKRKGYQQADGHLLALTEKPAENPQVIMAEKAEKIEVHRHKTAIRRHALSKPMQTLALHDYLNGSCSLFDYGCGQGDDLRELQAHGLSIRGWDPVFAPDNPKVPSDVVNLGFVINVIENPEERAKCLRDAFALSQRLLAVSAMLGSEAIISKFRPFGDGVLTQRNTFQKYYRQSELKAYIETILETNAIAAGPGIFYVFRDALDEQIFLSNRFRVRREWRQLTQPPEKIITRERQSLFDKHRALYEYLWEAVLDAGRCPVSAELEQGEEVKRAFGSIRKAFDTVVGFYGEDVFRQAQQARKNDLQVYFALEKFSGRKPYAHLPESLKRDVKVLFGDYKTAQSTELLFAAGKPEIINQACEQARNLGHLQENRSLTLHTSQIGKLPPVLRVYIGCATQLYGDAESADLVKIHVHSAKVSLMVYQDFTKKALPELIERIKIKLRTQDIDFFEYTGEYPPQPLYLKSRYIPPDFENYEKQRKFDEKLLQTGLFDLSGYGPKRDGFYAVLEKNRLAIRGFQLIQRRKS
ncbi:MAG: DNA phosphorothioation-associated putative methyltransferase [Gammaproteobacteria bacterium]|nr:DNA phosphorothioation-associated putative methyltransferase [Gammaproteobacteria bacterium]